MFGATVPISLLDGLRGFSILRRVHHLEGAVQDQRSDQIPTHNVVGPGPKDAIMMGPHRSEVCFCVTSA